MGLRGMSILDSEGKVLELESLWANSVTVLAFLRHFG